MQNDQKKVEVAVDDLIAKACGLLYARGLVANHDGNISFRLPGGKFLATPTSFSKGDVTREDLLTLDEQGKVIAGRHKVFSEISWHLAIYRVRPDVACVVHAHPPVAGGYALAGREIGVPALPEAIVSIGRAILNTKFISPLDPDLGKKDGPVDLELHRVLNESDAFLVPGNGAWAVGLDVMQTYYRLELVEQIARQHHAAEALGKLHRLSDALVEDLLRRRPARVSAGAAAASGVASTAKPVPARNSDPSGRPIPHVEKDKLAQIVRDELQQILR